VDAVVFDPDPFHGGKYVVQAKRYTNTVPVAAVRELWGTMNHEHASKGILVTTATFGPDAYEFAKDKPITLVDGSGLLFLLEKHGTKAFIDIKRARMSVA
jgi:restriction system protein